MTIQDLQQEVEDWTGTNFPQAEATDILLGVVEEVGEMAHAHLKKKQEIRGDGRLHQMEIIDAIGDVIVYLTHYSILMGINLEEAIDTTWRTVRERDWVKYPGNGVDV